MKNINAYLVGYRNSKKIISASAYLIKKYIPNEINTTFLNYGNFNGKTFNSNYFLIVVSNFSVMNCCLA